MSRSPENRHRRLLVIDDNPTIHDDFRKILAGEAMKGGYDADFGREAIRNSQ